ncbi:MAG: hypothetical protein ACJAR0_002038 [Candidatus Azotimanducaceae bacterium]|jgi:hypothetical protein
MVLAQPQFVTMTILRQHLMTALWALEHLLFSVMHRMDFSCLSCIFSQYKRTAGTPNR